MQAAMLDHFTHVLFVGQDCAVSLRGFEAMVDAKRDVIAALSVSSSFPFEPLIIEKSGDGKDWTRDRWEEFKRTLLGGGDVEVRVAQPSGCIVN
jgi:hypothetical protein